MVLVAAEMKPAVSSLDWCGCTHIRWYHDYKKPGECWACELNGVKKYVHAFKPLKKTTGPMWDHAVVRGASVKP